MNGLYRLRATDSSVRLSGRWLMKAGLPGFAWLTIASGWLMAAAYVAVFLGVLRAAIPTTSTAGVEQ